MESARHLAPHSVPVRAEFSLKNRSQNYAAFADTTKLATYWDALKAMKTALMATEQWDIVAGPGDRYLTL